MRASCRQLLNNCSHAVTISCMFYERVSYICCKNLGWTSLCLGYVYIASAFSPHFAHMFFVFCMHFVYILVHGWDAFFYACILYVLLYMHYFAGMLYYAWLGCILLNCSRAVRIFVCFMFVFCTHVVYICDALRCVWAMSTLAQHILHISPTCLL